MWEDSAVTVNKKKNGNGLNSDTCSDLVRDWLQSIFMFIIIIIIILLRKMENAKNSKFGQM